MDKTFRKFMEDEEKAAFISSLEDTLGVNPEDLKKEPQLASFFKFSVGTNLGSYKIVDLKRDRQGRITHAVVRPIDQDKAYKDDEGKIKEVPGSGVDKGEKLVAIKDLDGLLSQDMSASQPA